MNIGPATLTDHRVSLEPLDQRHAEGLFRAAAHDQIWTYLDEPAPRSIEAVHALISDARQDELRGARVAFAVIDRHSGLAVGSTSYIDIRNHDRGLEIGWTWTTPSVRGTGLNCELKYLLLRYAINKGAIRVALKRIFATSALNGR